MKKKSNYSLYVYTGLIFIAAIVVITLSFFGQLNAERAQEKYGADDKNASTIAEKTAKLSEENRILLETTDSLNDKIDDLTSENEEMAERLLTLEKQMTNTTKMYVIFNNLQKGDIKKAAVDFELLDPVFFTEEQDIFYTYLQNRIRKLY